jgi:hypothetical protein
LLGGVVLAVRLPYCGSSTGKLGDHAAMRALLRRDGFVELAKGVRRDKPVPPRVKRMIDCLTAGTGTHDQPGEWNL